MGDTFNGFNCFGHMIDMPQTSMYENIANLKLVQHQN